MGKKYVPDGVFLACDKGTCPSTYKVTFNNLTNVYSVPLASELDLIPFVNIKPMGFCMVKGMCTPMPLPWTGYKNDVLINGRLLLEDSTCQCMMGGKISIHFTRASANAVALWGGMKMPTEYIKDGFDWMAEQKETLRNLRDANLPEWLKPVAGATDWMEDFSTGLVEGAVNGVVGLGETIYQVAQDPVGTGEALGGMAAKGWDWASKGDNWTNAASSAWNWASDGSNWTQAAQDGASWVADNPRGLSNAIGQFIPDAVAAVYTGGGSLAATGAKVAGKEVLEEGAEIAVKEAVENAVEKGAKEVAGEAAEAGAKTVGRETVEELMKHADDGAIPLVKTGDEVIDLTPGSKGGWNKALNETLKPNAKYKVGNKLYETDELGRVKRVSGELELGKLGRNGYQQGKSVTLKDGTKGLDEGGHLVGHQFEGAGEQINYVPMKESLNQGAWKKMEMDWAKNLEAGKKVDVDIKPIYQGESKRPVGFRVNEVVDGVKKTYNYVN
jgi:predicted RecA/RadA family phage recombinase